MLLPVEVILESLVASLSDTMNAVLVAPPGAGKTTGVPPRLLQSKWLAGQKILLLEPRRIAARAAAMRMAMQRGEAAGDTVGYRTRLDTRVSSTTRIEVVTEGVLTRMLMQDPSLEGYGLIIFDEFHERSLQADTGLALVLEVQKVLRPDLRLLVMSATLDASSVSQLLGDAPLIQSPGRSYPVDVDYRAPGKTTAWLEHAAQVVISEAANTEGSVLVFVPGQRELRRLLRDISGRLPDGFTLYGLYGGLSAAEQDRVLAPEPEGLRKVVIATAIAETSLTLPDIRLVIDTGYQRLPAFDAGAGMGKLVTKRVSKSAAEQRAGRAGRVAPGRAIRLWARSETLAAHAPPEIESADLAPLVLDLAQWGCRDPSELEWLNPPPQKAWEQAVGLLSVLGLLATDGQLTPLGYRCQQRPVHPRLAAMMDYGEQLGVGSLAAKLAVLLEAQALTSSGADLRNQLPLFDLSSDARGSGSLKQALRAITTGVQRDVRTDISIGELLMVAFPDRIAQRRPGGPARFLLSNGRGCWLPEDDALAGEPWLVAASLDGQARESRIYAAAPITLAVIESKCADIVNEDELFWHDESASMRGLRHRKLGALNIASQTLDVFDEALLTKCLFDVLRDKGMETLPWTPDLRQWQARVQLMSALEPEKWPAVDDEALLSSCDVWATPFMTNVLRSRRWQSFSLRDALMSMLDYAQQQYLDRQLPTVFTVPTGNNIQVEYGQPSGPALRVKLQEMFGLTSTPSLAMGRVQLQLHLLSPAQRPVAVTSDLLSFWEQGYPQVRKDLRGRYPKHPWPDDPLKAIPQRGVKKKSQES